MTSIKELMNMGDRVAIITGGAGHLGRAYGEALAELGARIAVVDILNKETEEIAEKLNENFGVETFPLAIDLEQEDQAMTVAEQVMAKFGRIDILINNASFVGTSDLRDWVVPFDQQGVGVWRRALEVGLTAPFILAQSCFKALKESGTGTIINIGSIYGVVGPDMSLYEGTSMGNPVAYAAAKGGLTQMTRWLATSLAPDVRVNCISPGGVWREQPEKFHKRYIAKTPLQRMASEDDLKGAIIYLASDLSKYVTGQNLVVDGGWTVW
jgi:NAD(P)-dependent dehydrogenase (short-subunit alcohol dehydrogenase family)